MPSSAAMSCGLVCSEREERFSKKLTGRDYAGLGNSRYSLTPPSTLSDDYCCLFQVQVVPIYHELRVTTLTLASKQLTNKRYESMCPPGSAIV